MKNPRHAIASVALAATLALGGCAAPAGQSGQASNQQSSSTQQEASLASWNDDSPTIKLVKDYVKNVTDEKSADFIPKEDRVVTIDWDGTLYGELAMYVHRVLWDSTYTPTPEQVEVARQVEEVERTRKFPSGLEAQHAKCLAEVFGGMSVSDFKAYVAEFAETDAPKFKNLKRKDAYFKPMVELVKYLEANDFDCYIVSGTDRNVLQVLLKDYFPEIRPDHIKGSVSTVVASGQGDKDGLDYTWNKTDVPTLGGQLVIKDVKANKPTIIATEIGKQPVISLGNSSGDSSMANYVVNNNKYKSLALMLMCDDTTRDWGELDKAQSMKESCEKNGWHAVSERDEWKTIFGDGVSLDEGWTWSSEQAGPNRSQSENPAAASMDQAA